MVLGVIAPPKGVAATVIVLIPITTVIIQQCTKQTKSPAL